MKPSSTVPWRVLRGVSPHPRGRGLGDYPALHRRSPAPASEWARFDEFANQIVEPGRVERATGRARTPRKGRLFLQVPQDDLSCGQDSATHPRWMPNRVGFLRGGVCGSSRGDGNHWKPDHLVHRAAPDCIVVHGVGGGSCRGAALPEWWERDAASLCRPRSWNAPSGQADRRRRAGTATTQVPKGQKNG